MKHFAVIGDPVKHSLSPKMHEWIFDSLQINADYKDLKVKSHELLQIITNIKKGMLDGINVTLPHKENIIKYLDAISPKAKAIGSVNCIIKSGSKIIGNNTDWFGFTIALKKNDINLKGKSVIVLGAGGTARSIIFSLKNMGVNKIDILNRNIKNAKTLEDDCVSAYPLNASKEVIKSNSIIVNTTSVGMNSDQSLIRKNLINQNQTLIDVIYIPLETKFLQYGKDVGALTLNGLDMFIEQGLASLDLWFGSSISTKVNFTQLKAYLGSQLC